MCKLRIAVEDHPVLVYGNGAFRHFVEEYPIGMVGRFQGVQLVAGIALHHQRIHLPGPDGFNRIICLIELELQVLHLLQQLFICFI